MTGRLPRLLSSLTLLGSTLLAAPFALAQSTFQFDLPAQDLADALRAIGRQTSTNIIFEPAVVRGLKAGGVNGELTTDEAAQRLLLGTNLVARRTAAGTMVVQVGDQGGGTGRTGDDEAPAIVLEEIVVTATRRAESVRNVPYNIQAVSAQTLTNIGARSMSDYVRLVPGLSFTDEGARDGIRPFLRGLRSGDDVGLVPTTSTYVDDVQVDRPSTFRPLNLRLLDVERVEVLRGPQGTLYGGGSIGGTLRYITKKPDLREWQGRVGVGLSSTENGGTNNEVSALINAPLVEDKVGLRAAFGRYENDGVIDNVRLGRDDVDDDETLAGRVALRIEATERLSIDLTYYYEKGEYGDSSQAMSYLDDLQVDFDHDGEQTNTSHLAALSAAYDLGWAELTSSTSYFRDERESTADVTAQIRDNLYARLVSRFPPFISLPPFTVYNDVDSDSDAWSQELRLVSKGDGPLDWIAGGYWYDSDVHGHFQEHVPLPFTGQADMQSWLGLALNDDKEFVSDFEENFRQRAAFGEIGYRLTAQWRVSVGARYFDYEKKNTTWQINQWGFFGRDADGNAITEPVAEDYSYGAVDETGSVFRFNTSYNLSADDLIYLTIAEGYRPGGFNSSTSANPIPAEYREVQSDSITSYEVGGKFAFLAHRGYLSSAIYYIDWSDMQTQIQLPSLFGLRGNAGKAHSQGIELELGLRDVLLEGLSLAAGYSLNEVELDETVNGIGYEGERAPFVPHHSGSVIADYGFVLTQSLNAGVNFVGTYTGGSASTFGAVKPDLDFGAVPNFGYVELAGYWLFNMSARVEGERWTARAFLDNVFDKDADLYLALRESYSSYRPASYLERTTNRPRTFGVELSVRF
jgi:iron complex outermembrane recepter protein